MRFAVLVADDSPLVRKIATKSLSGIGLDLTVVENGSLAIAATRLMRFALILLDCEMPDINGMEVSRAIRADEQANRAQHTPIIAITTTAEFREQCLAAGMDDVVAKPADYRELVRKWLPKCPQSPRTTHN